MCSLPLIDSKVTQVLASCHEPVALNAVQAIIQNLVACEDLQETHQALHHLQACGFSGLWRFTGPFSKVGAGVSAGSVLGALRQGGC